MFLYHLLIFIYQNISKVIAVNTIISGFVISLGISSISPSSLWSTIETSYDVTSFNSKYILKSCVVLFCVVVISIYFFPTKTFLLEYKSIFKYLPVK